MSIHDINKRDQIISFLDSKIKSVEDLDKKKIITWNELKVDPFQCNLSNDVVN